MSCPVSVTADFCNNFPYLFGSHALQQSTHSVHSNPVLISVEFCGAFRPLNDRTTVKRQETRRQREGESNVTRTTCIVSAYGAPALNDVPPVLYFQKKISILVLS